MYRCDKTTFLSEVFNHCESRGGCASSSSCFPLLLPFLAAAAAASSCCSSALLAAAATRKSNLCIQNNTGNRFLHHNDLTPKGGASPKPQGGIQTQKSEDILCSNSEMRKEGVWSLSVEVGKQMVWDENKPYYDTTNWF